MAPGPVRRSVRTRVHRRGGGGGGGAAAPRRFAGDGAGAVGARFPVLPKLRDWEDVAVAGCPQGGSCLYLADLGDNYEERTYGLILRLPEPDPAQPDTLRPEVFPVRLPEGARDIEAMLVLPGERILVVTKGRNHPVTVYR